MITTWSEWKRYPRAGRGENIEAPISPGIYEVRFSGTGGLHSFGLAEKGIGYVSEGAHGAAITPEIKARVAELEARVVRGEIKIPTR